MSALDSRGLTRLQLLVNFGRLYLLDAPGRRRSNSWHNATEKLTSKQILFKLVGECEYQVRAKTGPGG